MVELIPISSNIMSYIPIWSLMATVMGLLFIYLLGTYIYDHTGGMTMRFADHLPFEKRAIVLMGTEQDAFLVTAISYYVYLCGQWVPLPGIVFRQGWFSQKQWDILYYLVPMYKGKRTTMARFTKLLYRQ